MHKRPKVSFQNYKWVCGWLHVLEKDASLPTHDNVGVLADVFAFERKSSGGPTQWASQWQWSSLCTPISILKKSQKQKLVINDMLWEIDDDKCVALVMLDLSMMPLIPFGNAPRDLTLTQQHSLHTHLLCLQLQRSTVSWCTPMTQSSIYIWT